MQGEDFDMPRVANRFCGGTRTNVNGLHVEQTTSLDDALQNAGYMVRGCRVYKGTNWNVDAKRNLYSMFLGPHGVDYKVLNSKQWQPDECLINFENQIAFIIEKKFKNNSGSVDKKPQGVILRSKSMKSYSGLLDM